MGEIRDAKLRIGIVYLCADCNNKRIAADIAMKRRSEDTVTDLMDIFFSSKRK